MQIHLIGIRDSPDHRSAVIKRLSSYEFALWGRDLMSVLPLPGVFSFFFLKKIYDNFVGTFETVRNREVSVPRHSTVYGFK